MNRKAWISVALLAVALAACEAPPPASPVTTRIGVLKEQSFLPYYVMQEQGFDKKNGLNFKESSFAGGAAATGPASRFLRGSSWTLSSPNSMAWAC